jgi:AcrR family transcriptional regulator
MIATIPSQHPAVNLICSVERKHLVTKMARPRSFDENEVLDQAMKVFWCMGYDGASVNELTRCMKMNAPSLYAAFGNKRGLFEAVLDRYQERRSQHKAWMLAGSTAREVAERMLFGAIEWLTDPDEPLGCFLIQSGLSTGTDNPDIPRELARRRNGIEDVLTTRFQLAKTDGDLPPDVDAASLARYVQTVFCGIGVQAAAGTPAAQLRDAAKRALEGWP